jgi:two-component system cell cycle response regulator
MAADSTSKLRALVVEQPSPGSVLFGYLNRPTAPQMPAVKPSGTLVLSEGSASDENEIKHALSLHDMPAWSDREGPATQRPDSAPPSMPSRVPESSAELTGTLTRIDGPNAGRVLSLRAEQITIGRSTRADLHLAEEGVSRKHARICWTDDAYVLEDLGSQNGTFVWGKAVTAAQLRQGDLIRVGPVATLRFCWMDEHQKNLLEELYESSVRDPLTGAFNRRHFAERLEAELAYAKRHSAELSLLLVDIDYFKKINDTYGHLEGDRVLRELTRACHQGLRTEDMFARYGGEEFAVLLYDARRDRVEDICRQLHATLAAHAIAHPTGASSGCVTFSIGAACIEPQPHRRTQGLVQLADEALYAAKERGRNRTIVMDREYETMDTGTFRVHRSHDVAA